MDSSDRCVTECRPFVVSVPLTSSIAPDPSLLQLDLPDPERDDISTMEFLARLEQAWAVCDRLICRPRSGVVASSVLSGTRRSVAVRDGALVFFSG